MVAGLVLLAYEVHQTNKLSETQAYVHRLDQMQNVASEFAQSDVLGNVYVKIGAIDMVDTDGKDNVERLTDIERLRLQSWERGVMLRMSGHYYQYLQGYLDEETGEKVLDDPVSRVDRWRALGIEIEGKDLKAAVAEKLKR